MTETVVPRHERAIVSALVVLTALSLVPVWTTPWLPMQDLPNHLLKVDIAHRYLQGDAEVRGIYALNLRLLSNYTCYVFMFLLEPIVGLMTSARLFLSLYLIALPACAYLLLRRVNPGATLLALALPALGYSLFMNKGNMNFCLALAIYLAGLAAFEATGPRRARHDVVFLLLATTLYFTHGLVFLTLTGAVISLLVLNPSRRGFRRALGLVPGLVCFFAVIIGEMESPSKGSALAPEFERPGRHLIEQAYLWLFGSYGTGFDTVFAWAWIAVIVALALYTTARAVADLRAGASFTAVAREHRLLLVAVALGVAYGIAPVRLADWGHLGARFIPLALLTLIAALRLPPSPAVRGVVAVVFVASALAITARTEIEYQRGSRAVAEYLDGLATLDAHAALLPIDMDPTEGNVRVNLHSWSYYHLQKGGWSPYLHAYPSYHPVIYRTPPWAPDETQQGQDLNPASLDRAARCYDYVLVWAPADLQPDVGPAFTPTGQSGLLRIWRNKTPPASAAPDAIQACLWTAEDALARTAPAKP